MNDPETPCTCITAHDRGVCIGWCRADESSHAVEWHGTFRGTDEDPRETGWCTVCEREVYDGENGHHQDSARDGKGVQP